MGPQHGSLDAGTAYFDECPENQVVTGRGPLLDAPASDLSSALTLCGELTVGKLRSGRGPGLAHRHPARAGPTHDRNAGTVVSGQCDRHGFHWTLRRRDRPDQVSVHPPDPLENAGGRVRRVARLALPT